ncbi:hypothetical protein BS78_04G170200, partial [Paspalum vaginatum]
MSRQHSPMEFWLGWVQNNTWELKNRIRQKLLNPGHLPSSYDTAWVAMVPAQGASEAPRFSGYDAIFSTLACILALKTWNIGDEHIRKGLQFIENNSSFIMDEKSYAPVGFNIIFPAMIRLGIELGLEFPLKQSEVDAIFRLREMELQRTMDGHSMASGGKAYMAYIAEGLADIMDWDKVLTYQSKNGSLFNSPSATAALAIHSHNTNALQYLEFLGNKFVSSAPAAYPLNSQLCMIDMLETMGISSHFSFEINSILDMTYRSILQNGEDIIMDMETYGNANHSTCIKFGADVLSQFAEESRFHDSVEGHLNDTKALLELYKASLFCISEDERTLQNIGSWSGKLLKQQLCSNRVSGSTSPQEVEYALDFPFYSATLDPLQHKRIIECFDIKYIRMQKTAYLRLQLYSSRIVKDILALASRDFHLSQSVYQQELEHIDRWWKQVGLDRLKFVRVMRWDVFVYLASMVFPPELYDASIAWIQNIILTIVVDDLFEYGGSAEELKNFLALIDKWDAHEGIEFCSEHVEIIFRAVYDTINQIAAMGAEVQNRRVIDHTARVWVDWVRAMMVEAQWTWRRHVPTMEEYMRNAEVSVGMDVIVMPSLYLVGPKLPVDMIRHLEYNSLLRHMLISHRLENDIGTYKKEMGDGYINSVLLRALRDDDAMSPASIEAAKTEIRGLIADSRRELLRLVVSEGGVIPRPCKDIFWNKYKIAH